ncbi:MAG: BhlA/UviB family holin-like peptide [Lachnospiraceae bacterium]|nr:BhlA/UviB family holin-like peptide [Lachnospiraceae bacterium]
MFDELVKAGAQNGIWTLFSISLLIWTLKENKEREKGYQDIINKLSDTINKDITNFSNDLVDVKQDVTDIKIMLK